MNFDSIDRYIVPDVQHPEDNRFIKSDNDGFTKRQSWFQDVTDESDQPAYWK